MYPLPMTEHYCNELSNRENKSTPIAGYHVGEQVLVSSQTVVIVGFKIFIQTQLPHTTAGINFPADTQSTKTSTPRPNGHSNSPPLRPLGLTATFLAPNLSYPFKSQL